MDWTKYSKKVVVVASPGVDQLGTEVGRAMPGDQVKFHMLASYTALRPKFRIALKTFGADTLRTKEYLSTLIDGSTAFMEVSIPSTSATIGTLKKSSPQSVADFLVPYVQTMTLGETAEFFIDFKLLDEKTKSLFFQERLKGQYESLPTDAQSLTIVLDCFRIVRSDPAGEKRVEHCRPNRNGNGAKAFESSMKNDSSQQSW
jgi:hypothetical protein